MKLIKQLDFKIFQSPIVKNSAWGIFANILQTLFVSLFFVIVARKYNTDDFAHFLIATTVYQLIMAFSSMGLGQWFIREYEQEIDKITFASKFIKIQTGLGLLFYLFNIGFAFVLYPEGQIRLLSIILGTNIVFDNIIYAIKNINIAEFKQKKTASILVIDGFLKLFVGCVLFIYPFSVIILSTLLIIVRFLTLNIFIKVGSSNNITLPNLWYSKVSLADLKTQLLLNWQFVIIGSVSIIYWRIGNIIISKFLTLQDVANYEISFRIFSIVLILPTIASATIYSQLIKYYNAGDYLILKQFYIKTYLLYNFFGMLSYAFIFSFADLILPFAFGSEYSSAGECIKQMFLTAIIFPTVLLQANLIIAMKFEKIDMSLNVLSLALNITGCFIGLSFYKSLSVINYSIFGSFLFFHISQNIFLIKKHVISFKSCILFYTVVISFVVGYRFITDQYNSYIVFPIFCVLVVLILIVILFKYQRNYLYKTVNFENTSRLANNK